MSSPWKRIAIHHSGTKDGETVSWGAIRRYHLEHNHWRDIGYPFGIEIIDGHYEILKGRPLTIEGAHAPGGNHDSIGVCIVGNFDLEPPSKDMLKYLARYLLAEQILTNQMQFPQCLVGHGGITPGRSCPGRLFDMEALIAYTRWEIANSEVLW